MNSTPLHPMLVHLPIALAVLMPLVAAGVLLAWWRGALPKRAWLAVVLLQLALVGSGFAALQTGEADEERVEAVVQEASIEAHEEAAQVFMVGAGLTLLVALAGFVVRKEGAARGIAVATVVMTLFVLGLGYRVGDAGGRLVYVEGAAAAYTGASPTPNRPAGLASQAGERGDDDDDD